MLTRLAFSDEVKAGIAIVTHQPTFKTLEGGLPAFPTGGGACGGGAW